MAIDLGAITKLSEGVDALRKFAESTAGTDEGEGGGAVPGDSSAVRMARKARENYQKTARWMLAAFATVGALIFGSLPFAAIADVELTWPGALVLIGGLVLAVAGIVAAVIAVSLVSEPEDASLGELDSDLREVQEVDDNGEFTFDDDKEPTFTVPAIRVWWNPRLRSRIQLAKILHGTESDAHLGPNLAPKGKRATVTHLIKKLRDLESDHERLAPVVAEKTAAVTIHEQRVADLTELLAELHRHRGEQPSEADTRIDEASTAYAESVATLGTIRLELVELQSELAKVADQLALYHDHRNLVLAESGVMQLRGTFRLARRILAVAAVLTLFGGTAYALSLPGSTDDEDTATAEEPATPNPAPVFATALPATVLVHEGTVPAAELPRACADRDLAAMWIGNGPVPPAVGPFTVVLTDPDCTGHITVARGEGQFRLD